MLPTPWRVQQLLAGKLGEGVFSGCDPLRTVPRSLRDTRRLAADSPSAVRVPGRLFLLDQQTRKMKNAANALEDGGGQPGWLLEELAGLQTNLTRAGLPKPE